MGAKWHTEPEMVKVSNQLSGVGVRETEVSRATQASPQPLRESMWIDQDPRSTGPLPQEALPPGWGEGTETSRPPPSPRCPPADLSPLSAALSINAPEGPALPLQAARPGLGAGRTPPSLL